MRMVEQMARQGREGQGESVCVSERRANASGQGQTRMDKARRAWE